MVAFKRTLLCKNCSLKNGQTNNKVWCISSKHVQIYFKKPQQVISAKTPCRTQLHFRHRKRQTQKWVLPNFLKILVVGNHWIFTSLKIIRNQTWLKTFSLKALELYTFILTCSLHKLIHNTMIPIAFGYTTKLFY